MSLIARFASQKTEPIQVPATLEYRNKIFICIIYTVQQWKWSKHMHNFEQKKKIDVKKHIFKGASMAQ